MSLVTPAEVERLREATGQMGLTMQAFSAMMARSARQIVQAFGLHLLDLDPLLCLDCRRRFPGPWQASKHRRTAHG